MAEDEKIQTGLSHVLEALKCTESLLRSVLEDKYANNEKIFAIEMKLQNAEKEIKSLLDVVRGNGRGGLWLRSSLFEKELETLNYKFEALSSKVDTLYERRERERSEADRNRVAVYIAVLTGIVSTVVAILSKFL